MTQLAVVAHQRKVKASVREALRRALEDAALHDVTWYSVDKARKAKKAVTKARKAGAEVVLVCGGDGTVRAASEGVVGSKTPLAIVPTGTANLFAGAMGIPTAPDDVVDLVVNGLTRTIDTGTCNGMTFNVMAGAGFDAAMIDDADAHKERLGMVAYLRAGVRNARERQPFHAVVTIDGNAFFDGAATCVLVGNLGTLKAGVQAFPDASPTDGRLDVAVVTATGMRQWASVMVSALRRRQHLSGFAHIGQGQDVSAQLDGKHRFQLDGGSKGTAKQLEFSVDPMSLTVFAPAE